MPHSPFQVPVGPRSRVRITTASGRIAVVAEERDDLLVSEGVDSPGDVHLDADGWLVVRASRRSSQVTIHVPRGTDVSLGTASAHISTQGDLGGVQATTKSGRIEVESATAADLRSVSGNLRLGRAGRCRVRSASGRVEITATARAEIATVSGRIVVGAGVDARIRTVSGRVEITADRGANVAAESVSGSVAIRIPAGCGADMRVHSKVGRLELEAPEGTDCVVRVRTMSGRVRVSDR